MTWQSRPAAHHAIAAVVVATALCAAAAARADAGAGRDAEALDAEAKALMEAQRYAEACPKLAASDRLKPGTGVILRLALCYERMGKTASAWSTFRVAATRAELAGDVTLTDLARKRAEGLEPRLATVRLRFPPGVDRSLVEVQCDGVPIDGVTLRADGPIHVDPGTHTLQTTAPGRLPFRETFVVAEGATVRAIAIELPLAKEGAAESTGAVAGLAGNRGDLQRTMALVVGGVGIAGIAVGSVFGLAATAKWSRARSGCTSGVSGCSADALELERIVRTDATWSTLGFGVGAAGLVGGAILWFTAPSRAGYAVAPLASGDRLGIQMGGRF